MIVSGSIFIVLGELILISRFSLTFGNVRSLDGSNIERRWKNTANMRKMSYRGRERQF